MSRGESNDSFIEKFIIAVIIGALMMFGGTKIKDKFKQLASDDMLTIEDK